MSDVRAGDIWKPAVISEDPPEEGLLYSCTSGVFHNKLASYF